MDNLEIYECAGCGGEISVIEAIWLPDKNQCRQWEIYAKPYCCEACYVSWKSNN